MREPRTKSDKSDTIKKEWNYEIENLDNEWIEITKSLQESIEVFQHPNWTFEDFSLDLEVIEHFENFNIEFENFNIEFEEITFK